MDGSTLAQNAPTETFKDRLLREQYELADKVDKLEKFLESKTVPITEVQQDLLDIQLLAMKTYLMILGKRIASL